MENRDPKKLRKLPVAIIEFKKLSYNDVYLPVVSDIRRWSFRFVETIINTSTSNVGDIEKVLNLPPRDMVVWFERDETISNFMSAVVINVDDVWKRIMKLLSLIENMMDELARAAVLDKKLRNIFIDRVRKYLTIEDENVIGDTCDDITSAVIAFKTRLLELTKLVMALYMNVKGHIPIFNMTEAKDKIYRTTIEYVNNILASEELEEKKRKLKARPVQ